MNRLKLPAIALLLALSCSAVADEDERLRALLVTGQINQWHNPDLMDQVVTQYLEETGLFEVIVARTPAAGEDMSSFAPDWSEFDVVVLNYEGDDWPAATRTAFEEWMREGGGLVSVHSTDNAFPHWVLFNRMIGLGGWGGRDAEAGPSLYWEDGEIRLDPAPGGTSHPPPHDFLVTARNPDHPILLDLPERWLHADDELYSRLRGPAQELELLATGMADPLQKDASGRNEPVLFTVRYGAGRIFHTTLGHIPTDATEPPAAVRCVGFITTLQRGTQWAASGRVTQPAPEDFPGADAVSVRPWSPIE
jgi:type 1 glutamine amidotransferase